MFALRAAYHTTLQATPCQLVFGRDAMLNVKFEANWQLIKQRKQKRILSTFTQVFSPRPNCTFVEFVAWGMSGFPSGPLPVHVSFSTKETAKTAGPTAPFGSLPKIQLSNGSQSYWSNSTSGSCLQDSTA